MLVFLLFCGSTFSNNPSNIAENSCIVHLDKSFYVTGEVAWFKLYLPPSVKDKPLVVRTFVFDQNGKVKEDFFLNSEGKTYVNGYYKIPFNNNSGMYRLVFIGQNGEQKVTIKLAETHFPIYNDLEALSIKKEDLHIPTSDNTVQVSSDLDVSFEVESDPKFPKMEKVMTTFTVQDQSSDPVTSEVLVPNIDWKVNASFDDGIGMYRMVFQKKTDDAKLTEVLVPVGQNYGAVSIGKDQLTNKTNDEESLFVNDLDVSIKLNKGSFTAREEITASITLKDKAGNPVEGNMSVSVTDWTLTGASVLSPNNIIPGKALSTENISAIENELFYPGIIKDTSDVAIQANLVGAWSSEENSIQFTKSDASGHFYLKMPAYFGSKSVQFLGHGEQEDIRVELQNEVKNGESTDLVYTQGILDYLNLSRRRKKIFQLYTSLEYNIVPAEKPLEITEMKPDRTVNLKEYEAFETLPLFFTEITSAGVRFLKNRNGQYEAGIYNPKQTFEGYFPGKPLFVIDGKVTRNADYVARIKYDLIETAGIYSDPRSMRRQFTAMAPAGAIVFTTNDPDFKLLAEEEEDIFEVNGLQKPADFPVFDPSSINNNPYQPFFRPQLYWNPAIETDNVGTAEVSFFQTDDVSTFLIEVVVQSADGRIVRGERKYVVK